MDKHSLIKTIYLYSFSMLGLILLIIGGVRFIDMGLKTLVFKEADEYTRMNYYQPEVPVWVDKIESIEELTEEELVILKKSLANYKEWNEKYSKIDPVKARRQREASISLALIIVGFPLYLYHWRVIREKPKKKK